MVDFYKDMQSLAASVIGDFKQGTVKYTRLVPGNGTPDNPGEPTEITSTIPCTVQGVQYRYINGTTIIGSDGQIKMPANLGFVPTIESFVEIDGRRHRIVQVTAIPPAGTPVVYDVIFKR